MPRVTTSARVGLHAAEAGSDAQTVLVLARADGHRSEAQQLRGFARRYRGVAFAARPGQPRAEHCTEGSAPIRQEARRAC